MRLRTPKKYIFLGGMPTDPLNLNKSFFPRDSAALNRVCLHKGSKSLISEIITFDIAPANIEITFDIFYN